jgi:hypothetical protein
VPFEQPSLQQSVGTEQLLPLSAWLLMQQYVALLHRPDRH